MWTYDIYILLFFCDILYVLCLIYDQYNCKYWIYVYLYVVWHWLIKNWIELNVQYNRKFNGPNTCLEAKWPPHTHFFCLSVFWKLVHPTFRSSPEACPHCLIHLVSFPPIIGPIQTLAPTFRSTSEACPYSPVHS